MGTFVLGSKRQQMVPSIPVNRTATGGGGGVTDHGLLTGLLDDDHTQYFNQSRGDARYLQLTGGTLSSTLNITPSSDITALSLKEYSVLPTTTLFSAKNISNTQMWSFNRTILDGTATSPNLITGIDWKFNTAGSANPTYSRNGLYLTLNAGFTGNGITNALAFENLAQGTTTKVWTMGNDYGLRPSGNRGFGGYVKLPVGTSSSNTTAQIGGLCCAVAGTSGTASDTWGFIGTSTVSKASSRNGGVLGIGYNNATGGLEFGVFAGLYNTTPTWGTISAALIADNGTRPTTQITSFRRAGVEVGKILPTGSFVQLSNSITTTNATKTTGLTINMSSAQYGDGLYSLDFVVFGQGTTDKAIFTFNVFLQVTSGVPTIIDVKESHIYRSDTSSSTNWIYGVEVSGNNLLITNTGKLSTTIPWTNTLKSITKN